MIIEPKHTVLLSGILEDELGIRCTTDRLQILAHELQSILMTPPIQSLDDWMNTCLHSSNTQQRAEILIQLLKMNETYFFREQPVLDVFEHQIIPQLIQKRSQTTKTIRVWCAGCSTGEEPYTLAMILRDRIPDVEQWSITILATDINPLSLQKAALGRYRDWSFRDAGANRFKKYFTQSSSHEYVIDPRIQKTVTFQQLNLAGDCYPPHQTNTEAMDVIFCRNVLMYFTPHHIQNTVQRLQASLQEGGWLIFGLAETGLISHPALHTQSFAHATVYQKRSYSSPPIHAAAMTAIDAAQTGEIQNISCESTGAGHRFIQRCDDMDCDDIDTMPSQPLRLSEPTRDHSVQNTLLDQAKHYFMQGQYKKVIDLLEPLQTKEAVLLTIRSFANMGRAQDAARLAEDEIKENPFAEELFYLQAVSEIEMGQINRAVCLLQQALYLNPNYILSHFLLGNLYHLQHNHKQAKLCMRNVMKLIARGMNNQPGNEWEEWTAEQLMKQSKSLYDAGEP